MTEPRQQPPGGPLGPPMGPYAQQGPQAPPTYAPADPYPAGGSPYPAPAPGYPGYGPQFGPQPLPTNDIGRYRPPGPSRGLLFGVGAAAVIAGLLLAAMFLRPPAPQPQPTATPNAGASASPSIPAKGLPFTMPSDAKSTGTWEIVDHQWTADGVSVHVRVNALTGTCSYSFAAFGKNSSQTTHPAPGDRQPELDAGILRAGESVDGYVFLPLQRGDATLLLTTALDRPISALPISG